MRVRWDADGFAVGMSHHDLMLRLYSRESNRGLCMASSRRTCGGLRLDTQAFVIKFFLSTAPRKTLGIPPVAVDQGPRRSEPSSNRSRGSRKFSWCRFTRNLHMQAIVVTVSMARCEGRTIFQRHLDSRLMSVCIHYCKVI